MVKYLFKVNVYGNQIIISDYTIDQVIDLNRRIFVWSGFYVTGGNVEFFCLLLIFLKVFPLFNLCKIFSYVSVFILRKSAKYCLKNGKHEPSL